MEILFEGQTVVVTGVARGIGRAIAQGFAERGAHVQALDILPDGLAECARDVSAARGGSVTTHQVDLGDAAAVNATIRRIEGQARSGAIDVLVHAAGGIRGRTKAPIEDVSDDDWHAIMDANVTAAFHLARAAAPAMKAAGKGRFIAISSQAGHRCQPDRNPGLWDRQGGGDRVRQAARRGTRSVRHHGQLRGAGVHARRARTT